MKCLVWNERDYKGRELLGILHDIPWFSNHVFVYILPAHVISCQIKRNMQCTIIQHDIDTIDSWVTIINYLILLTVIHIIILISQKRHRITPL